jgi:hypothetical protein
MVFSGGSRAFLEGLEWLEGLGAKRQGLMQNLQNFQGF